MRFGVVIERESYLWCDVSRDDLIELKIVVCRMKLKKN